MRPDEARALSDYRCAARKLARMLGEHGYPTAAEKVLDVLALVAAIVAEIRREGER